MSKRAHNTTKLPAMPKRSLPCRRTRKRYKTPAIFAQTWTVARSIIGPMLDILELVHLARLNRVLECTRGLLRRIKAALVINPAEWVCSVDYEELFPGLLYTSFNEKTNTLRFRCWNRLLCVQYREINSDLVKIQLRYYKYNETSLQQVTVSIPGQPGSAMNFPEVHPSVLEALRSNDTGYVFCLPLLRDAIACLR